MTVYKYYDEGAAVVYNEPGRVLFRRRIDIATIIANGVKGGLADSDGDRAALPSTGFAQNDVLEVFQVPEGVVITQCGARVKTAMTNAGTLSCGITDTDATLPAGQDSDGFFATFALNALGADMTAVTDGYGADNYMGVLFVDPDSIDLLFAAAVNHNDGVFDVWAAGFQAYQP